MRIGVVLNILDEEYQISVYKGIVQKAQELDVELSSQRLDYCTDQKRTEKSLSHGRKGINSIAFCGELDVLPLKKFFEFVHKSENTYLRYQVQD